MADVQAITIYRKFLGTNRNLTVFVPRDLARGGGIDRRSFRRGVFPGKRAQNQALGWAESGSGWERIVNADLAVGSTAAARSPGRALTGPADATKLADGGTHCDRGPERVRRDPGAFKWGTLVQVD